MNGTETGVSPATRCGLVLSAGNGVRMRDFVYRRRGDYLPKQYLNVVGTRSMLEHTFDRIEKQISPDKLFVVVAKEHLQFEEARQQIGSRPQECVVVQPENKDTGLGILLPLLLIRNHYPDAMVAIFPSDHFILEEELFMQHVERAFGIVENDSSVIVVLGIEPSEPDPEYGYIIPNNPGNPINFGGDNVELFVEKPSPQRAQLLIGKGALWNTLVVIATCKHLLEAIQRAAPDCYDCLDRIHDTIGTPGGQRLLEQVYKKLPSLNFSKSILENLSFGNRKKLQVLPVRGVTWSDWGSNERLTSTLRQLGAPDVAIPEPLALAQTNGSFALGPLDQKLNVAAPSAKKLKTK